MALKLPVHLCKGFRIISFLGAEGFPRVVADDVAPSLGVFSRVPVDAPRLGVLVFFVLQSPHPFSDGSGKCFESMC